MGNVYVGLECVDSPSNHSNMSHKLALNVQETALASKPQEPALASKPKCSVALKAPTQSISGEPSHFAQRIQNGVHSQHKPHVASCCLIIDPLRHCLEEEVELLPWRLIWVEGQFQPTQVVTILGRV